MTSLSQETVRYVVYAAFNIIVAREVNTVVTEPYMDEPFHIPQAQAYCRGEWGVWDPKITTPPGLYLLSVVFKHIFLFKCTVGVLRFTNVLLSLALPPLTSRLLAQLRRDRPPQSLLEPTTESIIISLFPIAWFFSFLYYTETGSLVLILACLLASLESHHTLAALLGLVSCTFRQTNIIWMVYAMAAGALKHLHQPPPSAGSQSFQSPLYNPPASQATIFDLVRGLASLPAAVMSIRDILLPYMSACAVFAALVIWNGGIVLGDKSNHIPQLHIPQLYYFVGFSTLMGLPILLSTPGGPWYLVQEVASRLIGTRRRLIVNTMLACLIALSIHFFTIHHPFLLSDNRHYTFYVWKRVFRSQPLAAYALSPGYLACFYAWFVRLYCPPSRQGSSLFPAMSMFHALLLPLCLLPVLLPTPLLEPRYFLVPYFLLRLQVNDQVHEGRLTGTPLGVLAEGIWYSFINWSTMSVFLYRERPNVGRFMW